MVLNKHNHITGSRLRDARILANKTAKEVGNSVGIILNKIKGFLDNLPEQEDLNKLMDKLPKEWETVKNEYDSIIGKKIEDNEVKGDKE